jgi:hypothetical protein
MVDRRSQTTPKYVITRNNPYYPRVEYADDLEKAFAIKSALLEDRSSTGEHDVKIVTAKIEFQYEMKMDY